MENYAVLCYNLDVQHRCAALPTGHAATAVLVLSDRRRGKTGTPSRPSIGSPTRAADHLRKGMGHESTRFFARRMAERTPGRQSPRCQKGCIQ